MKKDNLTTYSLSLKNLAIEAPLAKICSIKVNINDVVQVQTLLFTLLINGAIKPIYAAIDGTVTQINVERDDWINNQDIVMELLVNATALHDLPLVIDSLQLQAPTVLANILDDQTAPEVTFVPAVSNHMPPIMNTKPLEPIIQSQNYQRILALKNRFTNDPLPNDQPVIDNSISPSLNQSPPAPQKLNFKQMIAERKVLQNQTQVTSSSSATSHEVNNSGEQLNFLSTIEQKRQQLNDKLLNINQPSLVQPPTQKPIFNTLPQPASPLSQPLPQPASPLPKPTFTSSPKPNEVSLSSYDHCKVFVNLANLKKFHAFLQTKNHNFSSLLSLMIKLISKTLFHFPDMNYYKTNHNLVVTQQQNFNITDVKNTKLIYLDIIEVEKKITSQINHELMAATTITDANQNKLNITFAIINAYDGDIVWSPNPQHLSIMTLVINKISYIDHWAELTLFFDATIVSSKNLLLFLTKLKFVLENFKNSLF